MCYQFKTTIRLKLQLWRVSIESKAIYSFSGSWTVSEHLIQNIYSCSSAKIYQPFLFYSINTFQIIHCDRSWRQIGQVGFTVAQVPIHLSWNTCLSEHGRIMTCSSSMMLWKHIEQGDPSDFWIISTVAGTAWGSLAYLFPSLQKHA